MAVGTWGTGGNYPPPLPIFNQSKKFKSKKIMTYKSVYTNKAKIGSKFIGYWKSQIN